MRMRVFVVVMYAGACKGYATAGSKDGTTHGSVLAIGGKGDKHSPNVGGGSDRLHLADTGVGVPGDLVGGDGGAAVRGRRRPLDVLLRVGVDLRRGGLGPGRDAQPRGACAVHHHSGRGCEQTDKAEQQE